MRDEVGLGNGDLHLFASSTQLLSLLSAEGVDITHHEHVTTMSSSHVGLGEVEVSCHGGVVVAVDGELEKFLEGASDALVVFTLFVLGQIRLLGSLGEGEENFDKVDVVTVFRDEVVAKTAHDLVTGVDASKTDRGSQSLQHAGQEDGWKPHRGILIVF